MAKKTKEDKPKKTCSSCGRSKVYNKFYKVESPLFADGMLNICSDCIREQIDIEDIESVVGFLQQIDKPFVQKYWDEAINSGRYPLGEYIRKVNSLTQLRNTSFKDSDGFDESGNVSLNSDSVEREDGKIIQYSDSLVHRWGAGYKKYEYLKLEKFYQDMMLSYEVKTANHKQMLKQLAKLSVEMDNLLNAKDYQNYSKVSDTFDKLLKSSGFRPIDRKNGSDATGIYSFSQIWAEIEKDGFVEPEMIDYPKDDIDNMLLYYIQFVQRLVGKPVSVAPPENWRDEVADKDGK